MRFSTEEILCQSAELHPIQNKLTLILTFLLLGLLQLSQLYHSSVPKYLSHSAHCLGYVCVTPQAIKHRWDACWLFHTASAAIPTSPLLADIGGQGCRESSNNPSNLAFCNRSEQSYQPGKISSSTSFNSSVSNRSWLDCSQNQHTANETVMQFIFKLEGKNVINA